MERQEFEHIIDRCQEEWLRLGSWFFGHDGDDARDALQETLLRLWVVRQRLESEAEVRALGTRIMKNECVNIHRRNVRQTDSAVPDEPATDGDPHRQMVEEEKRAMMERAIGRLPFKTRCLMQLRYVEGLSLDEIAAATGKTKGSIKVVMSNAKQKIKLWIKMHEEE